MSKTTNLILIAKPHPDNDDDYNEIIDMCIAEEALPYAIVHIDFFHRDSKIRDRLLFKGETIKFNLVEVCDE